LLSKTRPRHGTVISASFQHAGLGQIGRQWHSKPGKNLFSVILYPRLAPDQQFQLSMAVALAIRQTLRRYLDVSLTIKWPNDIFAGNAKIGGILIQNTISGKRIQHTVAGVGINVNQRTFPKELPHPTSMLLETGRLHAVSEVLRQCLQHLTTTLGLIGQKQGSLHKQYVEALYRGGLPTDFVRSANGTLFTAVIEDVDVDGKLIVSVDGDKLAFGFNEIRMIVP
jgi:BirA family biotin operon repressor/biotin-[acetyl-CoA-carboxylase] ligase